MKTLTIASIVFFMTIRLVAQNFELTSPNDKLQATLTISDRISFSVKLKGETVVESAVIAMEMGAGRTLGYNAQVKDHTIKAFDQEIQPQLPFKDARIKASYQQLILNFEGEYQLHFRAYNDGFAYRFVDEDNNPTHVFDEELSITFPENTISFFPQEASMYSHNERSYLNKPLSEISGDKFCSLPVMLYTGSDKRLFTEASLHHYPGMFLKGGDGNVLKSTFPKYVLKAVPDEDTSPDRSQKLVEKADYIADVEGARAYPWRVFLISDDDRTFVESNLVTLLSGTSKIENADWIKPGKVAWDWYNANNIFGVDFESGINTKTYKYYIDFAAANNIEYVILDEGWTKSTTEIMEDNPEMNVAELIEYGKSRNVGIILWVLWKPLQENMDKILKLYSQWGAKGVKVDFMQRNDQGMVSSYEKIAETAANYHLMVDFHGSFKPAGIERRWPNVVNYEGVKGNEHNKWSEDITPEHNVTLPFIRMAAGPMDFTPGSLVNTNKENYRIRFTRPMSMGTRCHQVAMYVIYEAPLQMMCESPSIYYEEQETVDFITQIPTVWDETRVLKAAVSDYIIVARRRGDTWYMGAMTDGTSRNFTVNLSFLDEGRYEMEIMKDGANAHRYAEDYKKETMEADRNTTVAIEMKSGGGWAAILKRTKEN